jgi:hypothetical protein
MIRKMGLVYWILMLIVIFGVSCQEIQSDKVRDLVELSTDFEARLRKFAQRYNELYIFTKT